MQEMMICSAKQLPKIFSADVRSFLPIKIEALGAPPELTSAANADTIMIIGIQTPTPVRARLPLAGNVSDIDAVYDIVEHVNELCDYRGDGKSE